MQRKSYSSRRLVAHLKRGGLIAYPTESCFGLGCDPSNRKAVLKLLNLKQRPQRKGLILIASDYHQVERYLLPISSAERLRLMEEGAKAITCLMAVKPSTPRWLRGEHGTLAIRLTAHSFAKTLCCNVGTALVSTSANRSGQRPVKTYAECHRLFGKKVWVLPGRVGKLKKPSTILAWSDGKIIRK